MDFALLALLVDTRVVERQRSVSLCVRFQTFLGKVWPEDGDQSMPNTVTSPQGQALAELERYPCSLNLQEATSNPPNDTLQFGMIVHKSDDVRFTVPKGFPDASEMDEPGSVVPHDRLVVQLKFVHW